ncbi:MAG: hypothetical protein WC584_03165 [Candidatus Pacearchaeota archaeon]
MGIKDLKYKSCVVSLAESKYKLVNIYLVGISKKRRRIDNENVYFLDKRESQIVSMNPDSNVMKITNQVNQRVRTNICQIIDGIKTLDKMVVE